MTDRSEPKREAEPAEKSTLERCGRFRYGRMQPGCPLRGTDHCENDCPYRE